MVSAERTALNGLFVIRSRVSSDERGIFAKQFHGPTFYSSIGFNGGWAEAYWSHSRKNVIRGFHFQAPPSDHAKLVSCVHGSILDVAVDLRRSSDSYGRVFSLELSPSNGLSLFMDRGFAHGFMALSDDAVVQYLVETAHDPERDMGVRWDTCGFRWPEGAPRVISQRDLALPPLSDFHTPFK